MLGGLVALFGFMGYVAYGYSLRDSLGPGAGFFPFWLAVLGIALCLALLVQSLRGGSITESTEPLLPRADGARRAAAMVVALAGAALLLQPLGFRLVMLAFSAGLLLALGVRRPVTLIVVSLLCSFGLFHVFYYWLQVPLPVGVLGF